MQISPLIFPDNPLALFFITNIYYFCMSLGAISFLIQQLGRPDALQSDGNQLLRACGVYDLTKRETEIAERISRGLTYKEIASDLSISPNTVSNHVVNTYRKTGTRSKLEMVNKLRSTVPAKSV